MKKTLRVVVLVLLILVFIAYVGAQFFLASIVKAGVNRTGPRLTQSHVMLADASLSPLTGSGTLKGLTVGNPQGWSDANAIYLGEMHFDVQPTSLMSDTIVVNELNINQPEFTYETRLVASNIGDLMKNIEAATGSKAEPKDPATVEKKFIVKRFTLQNAKVSLGVGPAALPLELPAIELLDLGVKEGGLTSSQLTFAILKAITPQIMGAATKASGIGSGVGNAAGQAVKKAGEGLQKLFGEKKE